MVRRHYLDGAMSVVQAFANGCSSSVVSAARRDATVARFDGSLSWLDGDTLTVKRRVVMVSGHSPVFR